jgi:hypothetical protein
METSNISMIIVLNKMHFYYNVIIAMFEVNIICYSKEETYAYLCSNPFLSSV